MSKILAKYRNGNYSVMLFDNGTKIRSNQLDNLTPEFAESIDIEISNKCDGGCKYCYMNCTEHGEHADLHNPVFDTLHKGTEIALNGNDLSHPDLEDFLIRMKEKGVICNLTINQKHLSKNMDKLKDWQDRKLIWGIGISLTDSTDKELPTNFHKLKNTVLHIIDGIFTKQDMENLKDKKFTLLVLGYKIVGRGVTYYNEHKQEIEENIAYLRENLYQNKSWFNGIGFDTLATQHLNLREQVGEQNWALYHMGEEGEYTFFYNSVNKKFAVSSLEPEQFDELRSVDEMFQFVRKKQKFAN